MVDALSAVQEDIEGLEAEKNSAVQEERYDDAKRSKLEIEALIAAALRSNQSGRTDEQ